MVKPATISFWSIVIVSGTLISTLCTAVGAELVLQFAAVSQGPLFCPIQLSVGDGTVWPIAGSALLATTTPVAATVDGPEGL